MPKYWLISDRNHNTNSGNGTARYVSGPAYFVRNGPLARMH
jgi:hypothetical protein